MRFAGKTALVTGGARGIGLAISQRLARDGAHVVIMGRRAATLDSAVEQLVDAGLSASGVVGDVTDSAGITRIVDEVVSDRGAIDILVNNAALDDAAAFLDQTVEQWARVLQTDLVGAFTVAQTTARQMVRTGGGVIVNIGSINAFGADGSAIHSAAKAGLHALTRDIAVEMAGHGVRCVTVAPGWIDTEMTAAALRPEVMAALRTSFPRVPIGRLLRVEEIANVVGFAASDAASGMTGSEIVVDGGLLASLHVAKTVL